MNEDNDSVLLDKIQGVNSIQIEYVKRYWWISLPLIVAGIIFLKAGWNLNNSRLLNTGVILFCLEILTICIGLIFANQEARKSFMKKMASTLGLSFKENGVIEKTEAEIFKWGTTKEATNVIYGNYDGMSLWIYNLKTAMGGGKNAVSYRYTVFEITYPFQMPKLILLRKSIFNERVDFQKKVKVKLGSNLDKYFELYTEKDFEQEVQNIVTSDIMTLLLGEGSKINFEICENKVFIYKERFITKKEELISIYAVAKIISKKLIPKFKSLS